MEFDKLFKRLKARYINCAEMRLKIASYACLFGLILTGFLLFCLSTTDLASFAYQSFVMVPVLAIYPAGLLNLIRKSNLLKLVLIYFFYLLASMFWGETVADYKMTIKFIRWSLHVIAMIGAIHLIRPLLKNYSGALLIVCSMCVIPVFSELMDFYGNLSISSKLVRQYPIIHHNFTAQMFGFLALMFIILLNEAVKKGSSKLALWTISIALYFIITAVIFTASRGVIVSLLSVILMYTLLVRDRGVLVLLISVAFSVCTFAAVEQYLESTVPSGQRVEASSDVLIGRKDSGRMLFWKEMASRVQPSEILLGKGFLAYDKSLKRPDHFPHAHNTYLASFYKGGLVALALQLALMGIAGYVGFVCFRAERNVAVLVLLLFIAVLSLVDGEGVFVLSYKFSPIVIVFWLPVALAISWQYERERVS